MVQGMRRLLRGGVQLLGGKIVAGFGLFAANVILARALTPAEYGAYSIAFSILVIAAMLAQAGLNIGVVRFVAAGLATQRFGRVRGTLRLVAVLGIVSAAAAALILSLWPGAYLFGTVLNVPMLVALTPLVGIWVLLYAVKDTAIEGLRSFERMGWYALLSGAFTNASLLIAFGAILLLGVDLDLRGALVVSVLCWVLPTLLAFWRLGREYVRLPPGPGTLGNRELLSASIPAMGTFVLFFLQGYAPIWIVSATRTSEETAILAAIMRLQEIGVLPLSVVYSLSGPVIASLFAQRNTVELERMCRIFATVGAVPYLLFVIALALPGDRLFTAIFGPDYAAGYIPLLIFCGQRLIGAWGGVSHVALVMTGHQRAGLWISIASTLILFVGGMLVTPQYGLAGMGWVAVAAVTMRTAASWLILKRGIGIATHAWLSPRMVRPSFWRRTTRQIGQAPTPASQG